MLVIVVIDEPPLFDRTEPWLEQGNVGKRGAVERIDEGLGIGLARKIVEEGAGNRELAFEVGGQLGEIPNGLSAPSFWPSANAVVTPRPPSVVALAKICVGETKKPSA